MLQSAEFLGVALLGLNLLVAACAVRPNAQPAAADSAKLRPASGSLAADPLPSWRAGATKQALTDFVAGVTTQGGADFVPASERVAVFDNDGTLWSEQPVYNQLAFALDRLRELAPRHPEWLERQPFKQLLEGDVGALAASGERGLLEIIGATHFWNTTEEFAGVVKRWIATARHPRFDRPYTELVYQPMLELIEYLDGNGFEVFIVSGGGVEFMRPWVQGVYGIAPERVVGSRAKVKYEHESGAPVLRRLAEIELVDDGPGKPVGIHQQIGRRPIAAFGNSDGDFEMLEWATSGPGARFGLIVHHTDAEREWAYDRESRVGKLSRALDEAPRRGWVVADVKRDWAVVFPFEQRTEEEEEE